MNNISADQASSVRLGRVFKVGAGILLILVVLIFSGVIVASYLLPRRYVSKVTLELPGEFVGSGSASGLNSNAPRAYSPQYVERQFALLQKTEILYPVIQRLDLTKDYGTAGKPMPLQETYQQLRGAMKLTEVRNTGLVEISIADTEAQRAANIANAIATAFQEARQVDVGAEDGAKNGWQQLQEDLDAQRKIADEAMRVAMEIRARYGIADPDPEKESAVLSFPANAAAADGAPATSTAEAIAAKAKMTEYVEAKKKAIRTRKVLESMELALGGFQKAAPLEMARVKIWERAEPAGEPRNRIASLFETVLH